MKLGELLMYIGRVTEVAIIDSKTGECYEMGRNKDLILPLEMDLFEIVSITTKSECGIPVMFIYVK